MEPEAVVAKSRKGFIYVASFGGYYKIGRTKDPSKRLRSLVAVKFPETIQLRLRIAVDDSPTAEKALHAKYAGQRNRGEWFSITDLDLPEIERFLETEEYLTFLPELTRPIKRKQPRTTRPHVEETDETYDVDDYNTLDIDPSWKIRRVDLQPKPSLHDLPRVLKTENIADFARFPYSLTAASIALRSIGKHYGYNLCVIWDGPYNACVFKIETPVNGNGYK